jgi:tetratricopeptide (TPR) repeat protein
MNYPVPSRRFKAHSSRMIPFLAALLLLSGYGGHALGQDSILYRLVRDTRPPSNPQPRRLTPSTHRPQGPSRKEQTAQAVEDHIEAGNAARAAKRYDEAERQYNQAIRLKRTEARAYYGLGNVYIEQPLRSDSYEKAVRSYQKAIELNPRYAEAYYGLGIVAHSRQRYADAISQYESAVSRKPDYADAYNNLASIYVDLYRRSRLTSMQDAQKAVSNFQRALDSDPHYYAAYFNLGDLYYDMKLYQEAVNQYLRVISLKPDHAHAYFNLGLTYLQLNNKSEAAKQNATLQNLCPSLTGSELRTSCSNMANQLSQAINSATPR